MLKSLVDRCFKMSKIVSKCQNCFKMPKNGFIMSKSPADQVAGVSKCQNLFQNVKIRSHDKLSSPDYTACIGCYISHETIMATNEGYPVEVIHFTDWGVPDYYELILVTGDKYLNENKDVIRKFTKALRKGYEDAMKSSDDAINILSLNNEIDLEIETPGIEILQGFWDDGDGFGFQSSSKWSKFILWMKERDLIDNDILVESVFSNQFFVK